METAENAHLVWRLGCFSAPRRFFFLFLCAPYLGAFNNFHDANMVAAMNSDIQAKKEARNYTQIDNPLDALREYLKQRGNSKKAATVMGHSPEYVMSLYSEEHCLNRHFPFDKLVAVLNYTQDYWLLHWLACQCGHVAFPVPDGKHGVRQVAAVLRETAEAADAVLKAEEDGVITEQERLNALAEIDDALRALGALRRYVAGEPANGDR